MSNPVIPKFQIAGRLQFATSVALDFVDDLEQILSILVLEHGLCQLAHLLLVNPALAIGDAFETGHLQALSLFNDLNECRSLTE